MKNDHRCATLTNELICRDLVEEEERVGEEEEEESIVQ